MKHPVKMSIILETGYLHIEKGFLSRAKWFKGSKDRGFRGTLAAQKG